MTLRIPYSLLSLGLALALSLAGRPALAADTPSKLTAFTPKGTAIDTTTITVNGKSGPVWVASKENPNLVFKPSATAPTATTPLYLAITYLDHGYGKLAVTYKDPAGKWIKPDKSLTTTLLDSGRWAIAYFRLSDAPAKPLEVQVRRERSDDPSLAIYNVALQKTPFANANFQYLLDEPWMRPYTGPSAPKIDNQTLKGKVMVGYQGWFRTPNDPYNEGWIHWGGIDRGQFSVDIWPDVSQYPADTLDKAADVKLQSGKPGYLFSSGWPAVVQTHFRWMRENNIDGAFLQRFVPSGSYATNGKPEWVLGNVRAAANREGRIWAIEYDVSGAADDKLLDWIKTDWKWLIDKFGLRQDRSYARENGKLVVFVWGMGVPDRNISPATATAVVDFLKNDPTYGGNYVISGVAGNWRKNDPAYAEHMKKSDGVLAWMSKSYAEDVTEFKSWGVDYYPHVWPGFSWANLKHIPTGSTDQFTPREKGKYFNDLISQAKAAGVDRLFVGMFDEYDEGTAIMPMSNDVPTTPSRPGLVAKFFPNPNWKGQSTDVNLPQIDLALDGQPPAKKVPGTDFSVRFEGQIIPPTSGKYTFTVEGATGDTANLMIGKDRVRIPNLGDGKPATLTTTLTKGENAIYRLDYAHGGTATGNVRLLWEAPTIPKAPIPATNLVDAWGRFLTTDGLPATYWMKQAGAWNSK